MRNNVNKHFINIYADCKICRATLWIFVQGSSPGVKSTALHGTYSSIHLKASNVSLMTIRTGSEHNPSSPKKDDMPNPLHLALVYFVSHICLLCYCLSSMGLRSRDDSVLRKDTLGKQVPTQPGYGLLYHLPPKNLKLELSRTEPGTCCMQNRASD